MFELFYVLLKPESCHYYTVSYLHINFSFEQLCPGLPIQLQKKNKQEISYKLSCFQVPE